MRGYNASMGTQTTGYLEAIEHLPEGATLVIHEVSWDDYESLVRSLETRHLRVAYDCGRLEVVSPLSRHAAYSAIIEALVRIISDELDLKVEAYGCTTWKRRSLEKGVEADVCYYVANADRVSGKVELDMEIDPAPDIVVEIDITNESFSKFSIYAAVCSRNLALL